MNIAYLCALLFQVMMNLSREVPWADPAGCRHPTPRRRGAPTPGPYGDGGGGGETGVRPPSAVTRQICVCVCLGSRPNAVEQFSFPQRKKELGKEENCSTAFDCLGRRFRSCLRLVCRVGFVSCVCRVGDLQSLNGYLRTTLLHTGVDRRSRNMFSWKNAQ